MAQESNALAIVPAAIQPILAMVGSQGGKVATPHALSTIAARYLYYVERFPGFGPADLKAICLRLIHPAALAGMNFETEFLAKFAEFAAVQVQRVESRENARRQHADRSLPGSARVPLPSLVDYFERESFGNEIEGLIGQARGVETAREETRGQTESQLRRKGPARRDEEG